MLVRSLFVEGQMLITPHDSDLSLRLEFGELIGALFQPAEGPPGEDSW